MKTILFLALGFVLTACQPAKETDTEEAVAGFDRWGFSSACFVDASICPAIGWDLEEDQAFQASCREAGLQIIDCSCGPDLCSGKLKTGPDMNGVERTCAETPNPTFSCTNDFQAGDQYALDCQASGGTPIACGCHDYICFGAPQS
jgi:hypothetical protein